MAGVAVSGVSGVVGQLSKSELSSPGLMSSRSLYSMSVSGRFFVGKARYGLELTCNRPLGFLVHCSMKNT